MPFNAQELIPLLYIGFSLLAPMIPAIVIYEKLPMSGAEVKGPFQGLQIKLGGAFAAYFLLVLVSVAFLRTSPAPPNYEVWEIQGKLRLDPSGEIDDKQHPISIIPPFAEVTPQGHFSVFVAVPRKPNGELKFPALLMDYGDAYDKVTIPLKGLAKSNTASVPIDATNTIVLESDGAAKQIQLGGEVVLARRAQAKQGYLENNDDAVEATQLKLDGGEGQP